MAKRFIVTESSDSDSWVFPSPSKMITETERKVRESALQSRSWDWGSSIVKVPNDIDNDSFEDLLDEIQDLSLSTEEKHKILRPIYPPQEFFKSSLLILQNDGQKESENTHFLNVLKTAYGSDCTTTGSNTFRVNLILKGMKTVHSFDFSNDADYWRFLCGVRKGNRGEMENYVTGVCRIVGAHGDEESAATANKKLLGFNLGKFPKLTAQKETHDGQGRFIISHNILTFRVFGPKGQLSDDEEIINLMDIWSLAVTSDLSTVQSHSLLLQAELPEVVLKKGHNLMDFQFQLLNNGSSVPFPGKIQSIPVSVFPVTNRPSLCAVIPTTLAEAFQFTCQESQLQELMLKIVDSTHRIDIGQQTFTAHNMISEFKTIENLSIAAPSNHFSTSSGGAYSPKPSKRSSGLSAVRFNEVENTANRSSFEMNSNTNGNRVSGKSQVADPVMKLNTTQRIETLLISKGGERALKLEIKRASGLIAAANGKIPLVYCTIYLAGKNGQRLSSNVAEMRTEPIKSLDPEWNHEILIHDERLSKEEVEFVMVLLRDQSSGVLKHKHVGQVMIPLSCFLDTSAEFCLPIEPSYRMDSALSQTSFIGDIHLMTHMVRGEAVQQQLHPTSGNAKEGNKIFRVDSLRMSTFMTSLTMFRHYTGSTWWPVKILHPSTANVAGTSTTANAATPVPAGSANNNLLVNIGGSTTITPTYFSGFILPASEALLLSITNPLDFHYLPINPTNNTMLHLEITWSDVMDAESISESTVFLTLQLSSQQQHENGGHRSSSDATGVPDKRVVEFLVGPCDANKLTKLIQRRKRFQELGQNIAAIQLFKATNCSSHSSLSGPSSPLNPARATRSASVSRASFFGGAPSVRIISNNITNVYGVVETIRDTAEMVESLFKDLNTFVNNPESNMTLKDIVWEQLVLRNIVVYMRCKLVPLLLPHFPDQDELPDFTIAYIQKAVEKDKSFYQMLVPLRVNEKMESLNERYDAFMEEVARRIRDFVLFSSRVMHDGAGPTYTSQGTLLEPCNEEDIPEEARFCIQVLMEKYHEVLQQSLRPYIQSKQSFQAIQGQWLKNCVLKLLIEKNHQYEVVIATALRVQGLHVTQKSKFALVENIDEVLDWFASTLLQDTRLWLSKTIEQAHNKRENLYDLPWDTDLVGDRICSHLPESISFQLKVFMDVCVKDFSKGRRIIEASFASHTAAAAAAVATSASATGSNTVARTLFDDRNENAVEVAKAEFYKVANERLLQAIAQAWILLSNEYERSLLSKHWDQAKVKPEQDASVEFLSAIANDCYRIRRDQIMALNDIRANDTRKQEILGNLHNLFRNLQTQAITFVMRIVFSTAQRTLIDFEDIWLNPTDEQHSTSNSYATRTLLTNIRTWMLRMKNKLEYKVYRELMPNCVEVVVLRFFILFREVLAQKNGPPLRTEDIQKLRLDVEIMSTMLEDICEHDGDSSYDGLDSTLPEDTQKSRENNKNGYWVKDINNPDAAAGTRPLGPKVIYECVQDVLMFFHTMVMLLSEPVQSTQFTASMTWLLQDYELVYGTNHPPYFVEFLLVHCILPLRPQAAIETDTFLTVYHQLAQLVPARSTNNNNNNNIQESDMSNTAGPESKKRKPRRNLDQHDLYWRIFGNNKLFDSMAESYEAVGGVSVFGNNNNGNASSSASSSAASSNSSATNTFKFLSPSLAGKPGNSATNSGTNVAGLMRFKNILPLPKSTAGDVFKPLREKAADLRVFHNQRRQNEEILAILRLLGLGGGSNSNEEEHITGSGNDSNGSLASSTKMRPAKGVFGSFSNEGSDQVGDLPAGHGNNKDGHNNNSSNNAPRSIIQLVAASVTGSSSHILPANTHGTTYNGFLKITHIEVRKLHSAALFGECHPYVYFTLGDQRQKTSVKPTKHGATWDDIIALKVPTNLDFTTATLAVEVFDKELIRRKRLLGEVSINLDGLDMREFDSWFALEGGECAGVGEIHVKISLQRLNR